MDSGGRGPESDEVTVTIPNALPAKTAGLDGQGPES